jgi:hypothetical protein
MKQGEKSANMNYVSVINLCVQKKVPDASEIELVCVYFKAQGSQWVVR